MPPGQLQQPPAQLHRAQRALIGDVQMQAAAGLSLMLGGGGDKVHGRAHHAGQGQRVESIAEAVGVHPRRAHDGKGVGGAPALAPGGALKQTGAGIEQRRLEPGDGQTGHHPQPPPVPEGHLPGQAPAGDDVQVAVQLLLGVDHAGELAAGQAVALGHGPAAHKAAVVLPQQSTLYRAAQGVAPVQHHQPLVRPGAVGHDIFQGGNEGIVPAAHILNVIYQRVEPLQRRRGQALAALAVQAHHGQTGGDVHTVLKQLAGALVSPDAVLGRQQQPQITHLPQPVDGAAVVRRPAGGGGDQCHPPGKQLPAFFCQIDTE